MTQPSPAPHYLSSLNDQQRAAVEYCDGPQLVIAGAGSGKTRVLTHKIVHLLAQGYEPWRILALTFTNKAAREMRERIEALAGSDVARRLWMGTFHSVFARILRSNAELLGYPSDFTIYDAADSKALVKMLIKDMALDSKVYTHSAVQRTISWAKNALVSPQAYSRDPDLRQADNRGRRPRMAEIYQAYCSRCKVAGAMDFDDLLYNTNVLLRDHPEVASHYSGYFRYVLVDEYQDTNFAQHAIVRQLCPPGMVQRLCAVGDDAQSIYSFRGANVRNILDMETHFPGLKVFKLERNYRSTQNIIDAASSLISKNIDQIAKDVYSHNDRGKPIDVCRCYSDYEEAAVVSGRLAQVRRSSGSPWAECAVLYRTNAQSRLLEEALRKRAIPYRIYGGMSFYQRKEVKDAVAYLRLVLNPHDDEALRRVVNFPARGIGDTTMGRVAGAAVGAGVSMWHVITHLADYPDSGLKGAGARKLADFAAFIAKLRSGIDTEDAYTTAARIIDATGMMQLYSHDHTPENVSKQQNLTELLSGVREFVDDQREQDGGDLSLATFMTRVSLATDQDTRDQGDDCVTLMTVHAAKGLEFDNVFIVGAEEELFPSLMSYDSDGGIEEERRLMYVAITRARRYCMISYAASRYRNGQPVTPRPSRFIGDIDPAYLHLDTGRDFATAPAATAPRRPVRIPSAILGEGGGVNLNALRDGRLGKPSTPRTASTPSTSSTPLWATPAPTPASPPAAAAPAGATAGAGDFGRHTPAEVKVGTRILHSKFGHGLVEDIDTSGTDARMTVAFRGDDVPHRTLLFKFAKFIIL